MGQPSRAFKSNIGRRSITLVVRLFALFLKEIRSDCLYTKLQLFEHFFLRLIRRTIRQLNLKFFHLKNSVFPVSDFRLSSNVPNCRRKSDWFSWQHGNLQPSSPQFCIFAYVSFILSFKIIYHYFFFFYQCPCIRCCHLFALFCTFIILKFINFEDRRFLSRCIN